MRAGIAIALVASTLFAPSLARPARAYVRAINDQGAPFYWPTSCAAVTIYLNGFTMMTPDEVAKSIAAAAHAWSPSEVTCPGPNGDAGAGHPYFEIVPAMSTGGPVPGVGYDGKSSIIFETADWTLDSTIIAFTSHFSRPDGEIVDTDMEINAVDWTWANLDPSSTATGHDQDPVDLQAATTHEFGHFIGLAHTCFHQGFDQPAAPTDDQGQPVPDCPADPTMSSLPQAQSVMWFFVEPGFASIPKRILSPDDVRAVCDIYPAATDPHACTLNLPDDGCGCATGGSPRTEGAALGLLALGLAATHARRRRLRPDRARRAAP